MEGVVKKGVSMGLMVSEDGILGNTMREAFIYIIQGERVLKNGMDLM